MDWWHFFKENLKRTVCEEAFALHCIIHQQALCSKCLNFDSVMSDVVKFINHIRSRGIKHRQFRSFLEEIESVYEDVLYFTEVHWLSRGKVLKRFFESRAEVKAFMEKDGMTVPVLSDPKWLMDLAFLVDITQELNVLNKKLQGQGQLVSAAYDSVRAFSKKPVLWKAQLSQTNLCHFPACKVLMDSDGAIDLQCNSELKAKFREYLMRPSLSQTPPPAAPQGCTHTCFPGAKSCPLQRES
ncbi:General transcription factor II-I repeat domain-containing protein 2B [Takifugu flavidus]|uniref:General transcription factor II-I repeat domain-containing protein 2B n=1 Tax=Takifugu flavidus TaxID=433684 RepID=A0A5C6MML8_9TELE|nr:General transcription factor II-I repeat domain-containing protein 2B [Takifugu flavidus]